MSVRNDIVAYCRKAIGSSYDYTPSGGVEFKSYNCSYLSTKAYKAAGLTIPGWQGHQNGDGSQSDWVYRNGHWTTDMSKLKPGDLVFFGTSRTNTTHVAIVSKSGSTPYIIDSTPSRGVVERLLPTGAGFVGGGWPMATLPTDDAASTPTSIGGSYKIQSNSLNIRTAPSLSAEIVGHYSKGDTVNLDDTAFVADGYLWGRYTGSTSGKKRYIALGTHEMVSRV